MLADWPSSGKLRIIVRLINKGVKKLPKVVLRENESPEQLLRRFNKAMVKSKVLTDVRRKRWFVSKSELRRIERKKAARRAKRSQKQS